ncbi:phage tail protein [Kitasatospora viridis]|uniref:Phage tail-like protein n=1 Tax=Kitasatospora viridis TaxID=281105 RepID=A0A561TV67_9ACTN|nr:phage tail protein [Kitasatospora viridis]TWF90991.1 phage tail-like protein [Kitasatospora viridis]
MRRAVADLDTPYPIGGLLPAVFQEDRLAMRWTAALDEVLAPVISTLDCLDAYTDPLLAPADFVRWLAGWLGTVLDENWPLERQRAAVAHSVRLYRGRGTVEGLRALIELVTEGRVELAESGGIRWSAAPNTPLPGEDRAWFSVKVAVPDPSAVDVAALEELISAEKPAHVPHRLEVVKQ